MSIDAISDCNEIRFDDLVEENETSTKVLKHSHCCLRIFHQKSEFYTPNLEKHPLMARVTVRHRNKNGEENEISVEVDTRKQEKPQPQPEKSKGKYTY